MTPETRALLLECAELLEAQMRDKSNCGDPDAECPLQDACKPYAHPALATRLRAAADAGEGEREPGYVIRTDEAEAFAYTLGISVEAVRAIEREALTRKASWDAAREVPDVG